VVISSILSGIHSGIFQHQAKRVRNVHP
jgi:hypothetical protein